ncbi:SPOR domain-containing protein [Roseibium sp.]|uniref:SPOR domain-containing protein n=1 Tax=Roseibium sp. TaxID=1936156 RepID=UPI002639821F|nr:SPOR domain-containing protein [Roseibium sp.]
MPEKDSGSERPTVEDPLVELARIVHKNKQSGADVSSGRVGNTDYFAGLDEVADEHPAQDGNTADGSAVARTEPTFSSDQSLGNLPEFSEDGEPSGIGNVDGAFPGGEQHTQPDAPSVEIPKFEPEPPKPVANVSPLWPKAPEPKVDDTPVAAGQTAVSAGFSTQSQAYQVRPIETGFSSAASGEQTSLAPSVALDLEQNLTAELEDELIGVLRQSVDEDVEPEVQQSEIHEPVSLVRSVEGNAETVWPEDRQTDDAVDEFVQDAKRDSAVVSVEEDQISLSSVVPNVQPPEQSPAPDLEPSIAQALEQNIVPPVEPARPFGVRSDAREEETSAEETKRPAIDESDLFAALNETHAPFSAGDSQHRGGVKDDEDKLSGIDAIFADLDFPDPAERKSAQVEVSPQPPEKQVSAEEIDDMTWPAAVEAVPQTEADETPPPPEGYDLDAVARAMQESDPSLTGAGVLPPHPSAEEAATPRAKEKSRRGLVVAASVLGIAVLGGAGFFLMDGDAVQVPSGPPPVISGIQEPLKVYPEQAQAQADDSASKLIYDRVDGSGETGPARLILPESPQPAELPPAPAGSNGNAELVPGSPKRVTTYKVLPDGTIVSETEAADTGTAPAASASPNDASRVVATTPFVPGEIAEQPAASGSDPVVPVPAEPSVATPETPAQPETPAVSETPAIVAEPEAAQPETPAIAEPAVAVPSVLPRKKPAAPVQVASAPAAVTTPAPTAQNDGPLNLSQTASTPAPAAASGNPAATGSIPSGTYIVQVTSQRSATAASSAYAGLQRRYPAILGSQNAVIVPADLGDRGVFYRARIPTGSRDEAIRLCESLQGAGGDCFVRRQP